MLSNYIGKTVRLKNSETPNRNYYTKTESFGKNLSGQNSVLNLISRLLL